MKTSYKPVVALLVSLSLAGCGGGGAVNIAPDVTSFENGVIADVEAACQVEPTLASVAALFPIYGTAVASAANAICAAVAKVPVTSAVALLAVGPGTQTGKPIRHNFPSVIVHGHTIDFQ
jgi:predicted small lipoprotein YifL